MTPDEAKQVLAAARDSATMYHWQEIHDQLKDVHPMHVLSGTDQGDAAYLLGLAAMGLGDWDGAKVLLVEASTTAGHEFRAEATKHLTQVQHHNAAVAAESDQDVTQKEAAAVLAAADEALALSNWDDAYAHFWAAYNGHADSKVRARAAVGIARALSHKQDLKEAKQYATYAAGLGIADVTTEANALLSWITEQEGAAKAAADGTSIDEFNAANEAAKQAFGNREYGRAKTLLTSMLNSAQLGAVDRGKAALNLGMAQMMLQEYDLAGLNLEIAISHGSAKVSERAHHYQQLLGRHDQAEKLIAEFED